MNDEQQALHSKVAYGIVSNSEDNLQWNEKIIHHAKSISESIERSTEDEKNKMKNIKLTEKVVKRLTYARSVAIKLVLIIITGVEAVLAVVHFLDVRWRNLMSK